MNGSCPFCFSSLDSPAAFVCTGNCAEAHDDAATAILATQVRSHPVVVPPVPQPPLYAFCGQCGTRTEQRVCAVCHSRPPAWLSGATTNIAMAGARKSGKSVYIAVLKRQLELMAHEMGGSVSIRDRATETYFLKNYEEQLFDKRQMMGMTPSIRTGEMASASTPIPFSLTLPEQPDRTIVIRDVPGEDLERLPENTRPFECFQRADVVFFLVDPLQVPSVRHMLEGVLPNELPGGDPMRVLNNLTSLMRAGHSRIDVPLAVVLCKFDALQELRYVQDPHWAPVMSNPGAAYLRQPGQRSVALDEEDSRLLDAEVASLLVMLNANGLLSTIRSNYVTTRLFAVSALGHAPSGGEVGERGIAPFRCLDPLRWALRLGER